MGIIEANSISVCQVCDCQIETKIVTEFTEKYANAVCPYCSHRLDKHYS